MITRDLVRLGWPVLVAQVAVMLYGVIDTIMAGRYGTTDLAAVGIGASIYITVFITFMGVLLALTPVAAQLNGAGKFGEIGEQVRQCAWLGVVLSAAAILVMHRPDPFFLVTQAPVEVEAKARSYLAMIAWGVPALLFFRVFNAFSTAVSRPRVVMFFNLAGLALKVPLNWVFMYGNLGAPALGGTGCALATTIIAWLTCLGAWAFCALEPGYRPYRVFAHWSWPKWAPIRHLLAVGLPIGMTFLVDVTAFTFMTLFIARLGEVNSAAHQIAANFAALTFMLPLALGNAASVLVGQAIGAGDPARARATGFVALAIACALSVVFALAMFVFRDGVAALYSADAAVRASAAYLLAFVAGYHLADALQAVAINVIRGYKRTFVPMVIYTIALWGVGLAGGYLLGLTAIVVQPMGAAGFWTAAIASLAIAGALVLGYFDAVSRKALAVRDRKSVV